MAQTAKQLAASRKNIKKDRRPPASVAAVVGDTPSPVGRLSSVVS